MIRLATVDDRPHFLRLWSQFMEQQKKSGSHVLPNMNNLYLALGSFENFALGNIPGWSLFWWPEDEDEPVAMTMGGGEAAPNPWETDMDNICTLWGVYVTPDYRRQGIAAKLFVDLLRHGKEWGFDYFDTYVLADNDKSENLAESFGAKPFMNRYVVNLRDAAKFKEDQ